ncbi:MAG: DUF177 domain-containing protein [Deltaproteobacteria bacterium]|nr:DUF177 domain-containing protein [Deltaproteobacteria bacterium]
MILKISDLGRGPRRFDFDLDPSHLGDALGGRTDIDGDARARASVEASLYRRTVNVRGWVEVEFRFDCARCAGAFTGTHRVAWHLILSPHSDAPGPEEEDEGFGYYRNDRFDLGRAAAEYAALTMPEVLLCRDDCRGLCAGCGANLNEEPCRCAAKRE